MNVLFVASECAPFVKTGGLADVVSALPKALARSGVNVQILLPGYPALSELIEAGKAVLQVDDPVGGTLRLISVEAEGLSLLILDAPPLYARGGGIYLNDEGVDWSDNHLRFAALCRAAAFIAREGVDGWRPDILHAHDWQAGLAPAYLRLSGVRSVGVVTTIHNIAFQGLFPAATLSALALPDAALDIEGAEYHGHISFLKAGLVWADRITTVSPTYARQLAQPEFGMGFEGIIAARRDRLVGILNGIDTQVWDPRTDRALPATYYRRTLKRRNANREAICARFGLTLDADAPLFCVISRLTRQKGLDLLLDALPRLLARGAGIAVLGAGEQDLERGFLAAAETTPSQVGAEIGYNEDLSHLLQGGADAILIPSRFEPCGLTQLYGLRYGCLPVVSCTGGLADTVIDANEAALTADVATGIQFLPGSAAALGDAIDRTCDLHANQAAWTSAMRRAMDHPVGWESSAETYRSLYEKVRAESCTT